MTLFFPDLNVWLALSDPAHVHSPGAWNWINHESRDLSTGARLIFSRYTNVGLLRLLTNAAVMGPQIMTLRQAWRVYDTWRADPRVDFYPEPSGMDIAFRAATRPFEDQPSSKWVGDCYLIAYAKECRATLATFDKALLAAARKSGCRAIVPV